MPQDNATSIQGAVIRVTALDATGAPATGTTTSYVMESFIHVSFTPNYDTGTEVTQKNASGQICVEYKSPDTLKNVTLEVSICEPDPEFTALLCGGTLLTDTGATPQSVGWAPAAAGTDPNPNGVALDVWSYAVQNGRRAGTNPFFRWLFPSTKLQPSGARVIEDGLLANVYSGDGVGNSAYGTGPGGDWAWVSDRPYQYARVPTAPTGQTGYVAVS